MKPSSLFKSPKKEDTQIVPENHYQNIESLEEIKGLLGLNSCYDAKLEEEQEVCKLQDHFLVNNNNCVEHEFCEWGFMNSSWENISNHQEIKDESNYNIISSNNNVVKKEDYYGFWDENVMEETKVSLNLNLNYEDVLEAWSNRGSLWAHNHHLNLSMSNNHYMGEVPNLEDERTRRETSVLRYKEKRQNRLFSKKIRYEVRKLNADKRPRLKGRFVKRSSENNMIVNV